jgi:PAS domain S-box-containing protein
MSGHTLDRLLPPDRPEEVGALLDRIRKGERIAHYETVRMHKDGHLVEVSLTVSPIKAEDGRIVGISKIERDITAAKGLERSLSESEQRFKMLAANMDQLAWSSKADGSGLWFNKRWEEFTGWGQEEIAQRSKELYHPDHYERVMQSLGEHIAKGATWECTFPLKARDGTYRWFLSRASPQKDGQGDIVNWFGTSTDITERMRTEEALKEADRHKNEFLATLAHELRNPLAPLRSGLEVLQGIEGDETLARVRDVMRRQVDHMVRLVDDLLDLGRINSGRLQLRKEVIELGQALSGAVEATRPNLMAKAQVLDVHKTKEPAYVMGDMVRLTQVFSNLLHNASKYTPRRGHIALSMATAEGRVRVTVQDDGIGISEDMRSRVFDMFTQADPGERSKAGGGLGIGLHLVQRLVGMHGGEVGVAPNLEGPGTMFWVELPLTEPPHQAPAGGPPSGKTNFRKILVVDDNKDSAFMLTMLFKALKCDAQAANSGEEALRKGKEDAPEVVIMDIGMPGMNGYQTCRRMRETSWGSKALIIALSGWGQDEDKRRSHEAGFDAHLVKPVDRETLLGILDQGPGK